MAWYALASLSPAALLGLACLLGGGWAWAGLVSVMLKVVNGNPQHGDWIFREYVRPRPDAAYTVLAENEACWSCHDGAGDTDWVFTKADG